MNKVSLQLRPGGIVTGLHPVCTAGHLTEGLKKNRITKNGFLQGYVTFDSNKTPHVGTVTTLISGIINGPLLQGTWRGFR